MKLECNIKKCCTIFLIAICIIFLFTGCKKNEKQGDIQETESPKTSQNEEGSSEKPVRTLTLKEEEGVGDTTETAENQTGAQVPFHAEKADRLAEKWLLPIEPEDFEIGTLEKESQLARSMYIFFQNFINGNIRKDYIHPEWENRIMTIYDSLNQGEEIPKDVRIGKFVLEGNTQFFPVRFIDDVSSAEGIVYLQKHEGEWRVSDMQINPKVKRKSAEEEGKFQPSMYQWMGK